VGPPPSPKRTSPRPEQKRALITGKWMGFVQQKWSYREKWRVLSTKKIGFTVLPKKDGGVTKKSRFYERKIKVLPRKKEVLPTS